MARRSWSVVRGSSCGREERRGKGEGGGGEASRADIPPLSCPPPPLFPLHPHLDAYVGPVCQGVALQCPVPAHVPFGDFVAGEVGGVVGEGGDVQVLHVLPGLARGGGGQRRGSIEKGGLRRASLVAAAGVAPLYAPLGGSL